MNRQQIRQWLDREKLLWAASRGLAKLPTVVDNEARFDGNRAITLLRKVAEERGVMKEAEELLVGSSYREVGSPSSVKYLWDSLVKETVSRFRRGEE
jgi:hypothetical protein